MNKIKVITVIGTRPEIIRLSRVLVKLDQFFDHTIVHTGQNYDYELNQVFFDDLELRKPDYFLEAASSSTSAIQTIANILVSVERILSEIKPNAMLVLGDTNSCLSVIVAKKYKIPIFHMEAGNRCFDQRVPEETNRRIVDHIADVNLTYSSIAREYLLREGLPPDFVIKTGSPMSEVLNYYKYKIKKSNVLTKLNLVQYGYFLISAHREENIDSEISFVNLIGLINLLAVKYRLPIIFSAHPRTQKRINELQMKFEPEVRLLKPLGFLDYNYLQMNAKAVLSDSGTITEESAILNFPALNLREAHERPEGMEESSVMMIGGSEKLLVSALEILEKQGRGAERTLSVVRDYDVPNVSDKIVRIILSYFEYVNSKVWRK